MDSNNRLIWYFDLIFRLVTLEWQGWLSLVSRKSQCLLARLTKDSQPCQLRNDWKALVKYFLCIPSFR